MSDILSASDKKQIDIVKESGNIPHHIAIIMDGNGRWAKQNNLPRAAGHKKGVDTVREIVEACVALDVKILTLYTFSTENWKRPKDEVSTLMKLFVKSLRKEINNLNRNGIRLTSIGDKRMLPNLVCQELELGIEKTSHNSKMILNLALSYSGRWELVEAVKAISLDVLNKKLKPADICEETISRHLSTSEFKDPDLLIRSGGELRISNFLLWQIAYSEIFVTDTLWPEFKTKNLLEAIKDFQKRERRFGLVSEQLSEKTKMSNNVSTHSKKLHKV